MHDLDMSKNTSTMYAQVGRLRMMTRAQEKILQSKDIVAESSFSKQTDNIWKIYMYGKHH